MVTSINPAEASASKSEIENLKMTIEAFMRRKPVSNKCADILLELSGDVATLTPETFEEMTAFAVDLLSFFCIPENVAAFRKMPGLYPKDSLPIYLNRIVTAFTMLQKPYPHAEMTLSHLKQFDLTSHEVESLMDDFKQAA